MENEINKIDENSILIRCASDLYEQVDFFLGAGASISSGIPSGSEITCRLKDLYKKQKLQNNCPPDGSDDEYSFYFEQCFPEITERDAFIKRLIKDKKPSDGYIKLGAILSSKFSKTVWTTNFDNLILLGLKAVNQNDVREYNTDNIPPINLIRNEEYPTICRLHGDIKYVHTKNISSELDKLEAEMENCFKYVLTKKALFIIGYAGIDNSIMSFFEKNAGEPDFLSKGLYWFNVKGGRLSERAKKLLIQLKNINKPSGLVEIESFDDFMHKLCHYLDIKTTDYLTPVSDYWFNSKMIDKYLPIRKPIPNITEDIYEKFLYSEVDNTESLGILEFQKHILSEIKICEWDDLPNIILKGIAGIGKTTEMKLLYNKIIDGDKNIVPLFFELQNYTSIMFGMFFSPNSKFLLFLDGCEEFKDDLSIRLLKDIKNLLSLQKNVRIIISGRDSFFTEKFDQEFKFKTFILKPYIDKNQESTKELICKFSDSLIKYFLDIPLYRNMAMSGKFNTQISYEEQYLFLLKHILFSDKIRFNYAANITTRSERVSEINFPTIIQILLKLSEKLIDKDDYVFSEDDLYDVCCNSDEYEFLLKSALFNYYGKERIEFVSTQYLYYFLSLYILDLPKRKIKNLLFTRSGKIKKKYLEMSYVLFKIVKQGTPLYDDIVSNLDSSAGILLTDFTHMTSNERYDFYKKIIKEYNARKKTIYYYRFNKTNDILANIDSLADSMHRLLPEDFYSQAVQEHCDLVKEFLNHPNIENIRSFENALILLGVRNSDWQDEQQKMLNEISILLIKFFLNDKMAEKMRRILSENIVLRWYENYNWTKDWNKESDWISFVNELTDIENEDLYDLSNEKQYRLKLKLFIHFHNNELVRKLLVPLSKKILTSRNNGLNIDSCVPRNIDDNFETPILEFDSDIYRFTDIFKNYDVSIDSVLQILQIYPIEYYAIPFEAHDLYNEILKAFEIKIPTIKDENISEFYKVLFKYIEANSGIHLEDFSKYIKLLNDDQKEKVFNLLFADLTKKTDWQNLWMLPRIIIVPLLDMVDKEKSIHFFEKLKDVDSVYRNCIDNLYRKENKEHPLYNLAAIEYTKLFADRIILDKRLKEKLDSFNVEKDYILEKEFDVITNKDNSLSNEVNRIFEYIDKHPDFSESKDIQGKLFDLQIGHIEWQLRYDFKEKYVKPDVFSPFAVDFLIHSNEDDTKLNHENIIKRINDWFSNEKYFWRYFFWTYISYHKKEEVDEVLNKYPLLTERIKGSMQQEVTQFLVENDVSMYDGGKNSYWVNPFVDYLTGKIYNNKLPEWFDQNKILNFIAYPAWQLSSGYSLHVNGEFKWKRWGSVFEWIEEVAGVDEDNIIRQALILFPNLKNELSKAQIISVFVEKVKSESVYKQQMLDIIINITNIEMQKDYNNNNNDLINWILSSFWSRTTEDFVERIYSSIDFEKYNLEDKNYCRTAILEYFCNVANDEQKNKVINLLKDKTDMPNMRMYLAKLGYEKAIIAIIDGFLNDDDLNRDWDYSKLFMNPTQSFKLLCKYCDLYSYSLKKENYRREHLIGLAKRGILQTATRSNFEYIQSFLNTEIETLKEKGVNYEYVQDFLNEIEQRVFLDYSEEDSENRFNIAKTKIFSLCHYHIKRRVIKKVQRH